MLSSVIGAPGGCFVRHHRDRAGGHKRSPLRPAAHPQASEQDLPLGLGFVRQLLRENLKLDRTNNQELAIRTARCLGSTRSGTPSSLVGGRPLVAASGLALGPSFRFASSLGTS